MFLYERASRKDRKKRSHVCGWTHGKLSPHCAHTASSHQAAERRLNGLSGDYTQINQSTVTLHHIGAVCVTQSAAAVICETCCMPLHHLQHSLKALRVNKVLFSAVFGLDMTNAAHGPSCWLSTLN